MTEPWKAAFLLKDFAMRAADEQDAEKTFTFLKLFSDVADVAAKKKC